jgi:alcohol dehydrogenase class IV
LFETWGENPNDKPTVPFDFTAALGCLREFANKPLREIFLQAVDEPGNLDARSDMVLAETLGGLAIFNCRVDLVHAIEEMTELKTVVIHSK